MCLRQDGQAVRFVAQHLEWSERLAERFGEPFGGIEGGRQHKGAWIVAMQFAARRLEVRKCMRKTGRAASRSRTAQYRALEGGDRARVRPRFGAETKQGMLQHRQQW